MPANCRSFESTNAMLRPCDVCRTGIRGVLILLVLMLDEVDMNDGEAELVVVVAVDRSG